MLLWWAVFFVSGCRVPSRSITLSLMILLFMLSVHCLDGVWERRRFVIFVLCASTSLVIWTATLSPESSGSSGPLTGGPPLLAAAARERVLDSLDDPRLNERSVDLLSALLFGYRGRLDPDLRESYAYLGIAHFLALSGLHLGILSIPLVWAIAYLPIGRVMKAACICILLACYTILACLPPSLVRATALVSLFMVQRSIGRKTTLIRSLSLAFLVIVLIDEQIIHSAGFQLSCSAVLAIALLGIPVICMIRSGLRRRMLTRMVILVLSPALIALSVNVLTLPLQILFFGRSPLLAPAYNLMMIIPVTLLLYLGQIYSILPVGPVRALTAPPINLITDILWDVPMRLSSNPQPAILSGSFCWPLYLAGTGFLALALRQRQRRRIQCVCVASVFLIVSFIVGGDHNLSWMPYGRGALEESIALSPNVILLSGELLVVEKDIGRREAEKIVRSLWKMGIGRIETLLLCPARLGRRGGTKHILSRIDFTRVLCSPYLAGYDGGLMEKLRSRRIETLIIERSDSFDAGGKKIRLIAPDYPLHPGEVLTMENACIRFELWPPDNTE